MSVSLKQTHMHVNSAYVNVCVCSRIQVQLKGLHECRLFSSICWLTGNCEELIVILCTSLCAVHLLQQHELGINSMSDLK
jgi:hypothetical protein